MADNYGGAARILERHVTGKIGKQTSPCGRSRGKKPLKKVVVNSPRRAVGMLTEGLNQESRGAAIMAGTDSTTKTTNTQNDGYEDEGYKTQYGRMTAVEYAEKAMDRTRKRLDFLSDLFEAIGWSSIVDAGDCSERLRLQSHHWLGLGVIMGDCARDISEAQCFYRGDTKTPGRLA